MGVDLFSDLQPRITKDDEEATNNIIPWLDNLSKTTLMGPVPKYIVFKVNIILQEVDLLREGIFGVNALLIFIDGEKLFLTIHNFIFLLRDVGSRSLDRSSSCKGRRSVLDRHLDPRPQRTPDLASVSRFESSGWTQSHQGWGC